MGRQWLEAWLRVQWAAWGVSSQRAVRHRERGDIIAQYAVLIGVTAAVGLGLVLAFMQGLGGVFTKSLAKFAGLVP